MRFRPLVSEVPWSGVRETNQYGQTVRPLESESLTNPYFSLSEILIEVITSTKYPLGIYEERGKP
jgi:hypothetical protein